MNTAEHEDDELIGRIREKAHRKEALSSVASPDELEVAERSLGFPLYSFHRRLLAEVADGGFGAGFGIYGVGADGYRDEQLGGGLVEVRQGL